MVRNAYSWGVRTIVIDYPLAPQGIPPYDIKYKYLVLLEVH